METQAHGAGPRRDRQLPRPVSMEAAGPASPRLVIEEVKLRVSADSVKAEVSLAIASHRFAGTATGRDHTQPTWKLAAAATVSAIQQYLQQSTPLQPVPRIELVDLATATTGLGQNVIHATLSFVDGNQQLQLLGSALVRNTWHSTAVAAALDASARHIVRRFPPIEHPAPVEPSVLDNLPIHTRDLMLEDPFALTGLREAYLAPGNGGTSPVAESTPPADPEPPVVVHDQRRPEDAPRAEPPPADPGPSVAEHDERPPDDAPRLQSAAPAITLGVEISATSVRAAVVDREGKVLREARRPSRASADPEPTLSMALEAARAALGNLDPDALAGIGIAMPGRLRPSEGICVSCGDFPAWRDVQLAAPFAHDFGLPTSLIAVTQAAGLAEARFGAARELSSVILVRVGLDIDLAVISGGQHLILGEAGPSQAGHMVIAPGGPRCTCGESGCWQAVAGRDAMVARVVRDIGGGVPSAISAAVGNRLGAVTPALICQMAAAGDAVARNALEETGRYLALGLGNLITLFDPEAIILDSAPAPVGSALRHAAETALKSSPRAHIFSRCVLLSPALGDSAPVLGAAAWASLQLRRSPIPLS